MLKESLKIFETKFLHFVFYLISEIKRNSRKLLFKIEINLEFVSNI